MKRVLRWYGRLIWGTFFLIFGVGFYWVSKHYHFDDSTQNVASLAAGMGIFFFITSLKVLWRKRK
jgi:hypothetical protein